jgi:hypothetical protein
MRNMELKEIFKEINRTRGPVGSHQLPDRSGVYALFLREDLLTCGLVPSGDCCIYIGISVNLAQRLFKNHFATDNTGSSTVRRSLGALLKKRMQLKAMARSGGISETNFRNFRFDLEGEKRLTKWMRKNLEIGFCVVEDSIGEMERGLLSELNPVLNLKGCRSPLRQIIIELRKACVAEARRCQTV